MGRAVFNMSPCEAVTDGSRRTAACHPEENLSKAKIRLEGRCGPPHHDTVTDVLKGGAKATEAQRLWRRLAVQE
jgi:hypothetical protein